MPAPQQQILALFVEHDQDIQTVIREVLQFEQENIHLKEPRYTRAIQDIIDRVARETLKDAPHEN